MAHGLDDVAGPGLALGADHGGAFANAAEGLAEVAAPAHKGDGEGVLLDVVSVVGGGEDFGLVDVVDTDGFEDLEKEVGLVGVAWRGEEGSEAGVNGTYLALNKVSDSGLGHDGDGHRGHDVLDHLWVGHAGYAALDADIGGHALERHDGAGAGLLSDAGL